jgi:hypothetical protein
VNRVSIDVERLREEYLAAMRAWRAALTARLEWHQQYFQGLAARARGFLSSHELDERAALRKAEEVAYERLVQARDTLTRALRSIRKS